MPGASYNEWHYKRQRLPRGYVGALLPLATCYGGFCHSAATACVELSLDRGSAAARRLLRTFRAVLGIHRCTGCASHSFAGELSSQA